MEGEGEEPRRALTMLVRRTAPFQVETGRWRGVPWEESLCRECERKEKVEDCNHVTVSQVGIKKTAAFDKC